MPRTGEEIQADIDWLVDKMVKAGWTLERMREVFKAALEEADSGV